MRTAEDILEEYGRGDLCVRLNLYLEHRDLRHEFMRIDSDDPALPQAAISKKNVSRIMVAITSLRYRIARCCSP